MSGDVGPDIAAVGPLARAIRDAVKVRTLGPNSRAVLDAGGPISLTSTEAKEAATTLAPLIAERVRAARAEAWDEGWRAAQEVVELEGVKCWAHTVFPLGYEGNPYRAAALDPGPRP